MTTNLRKKRLIETVNLLFHAALEFVAHNANKMQIHDINKLLPNVQKAGCKESHFYSLPFRQAEANIY